AMGDQPNGDHLVCIDLDRHAGDGVAEYAALLRQHGDSIDTWRAITGSAGMHVIYRAPPGRIARNQQGAGKRLGDNIDVRGQGGQIVVAPSVHPTTGMRYEWRHNPWEHRIATMPDWLADDVCEPLTSMTTTPSPVSPARPAPTGPSIADQLRDTFDWHHELTARGWTLDQTKGVDTFWVRPGKNPRGGHSAVLHGDGPLVVFSTDTGLGGLHRAGKPTADGGGYTLTPLQFVAGHDHGGDLSAASRHLIGQRTPATAPPGINTDTGEIMPAIIIDDDWWTARPILDHIRIAARARRVAPTAVLGCVLARIAASTPPSTCIPPFVGSTVPLSLYIALMSGTGGSKSSPQSVARELMPTLPAGVVGPLPLGSGEGVAVALLELVEVTDDNGKKTRRKTQTRHGALCVLDEGLILAEMSGRRGATIIPTLCTAWTGGDLGQANATIETWRAVPAGGYSVGLISGWQPTHAAGLFDETESGLPGRFIFLPTDDPDAPDIAPDWPGQLDWTPPPLIRSTDIRHDPLTYDAAIAAEVDAGRLARLRGHHQPDPLDAHRTLSQLKIAGVLAVLDDRRDVTGDDWELARQLLVVSERVRGVVLNHIAADAQRREQAAISRTIARN
ncbi:MAG: bifunctional DNA primase/polymerase, partial [Candidatus Nanopelagicales bacterium]